jgi:hypothetical protein
MLFSVRTPVVFLTYVMKRSELISVQLHPRKQKIWHLASWKMNFLFSPVVRFFTSFLDVPPFTNRKVKLEIFTTQKWSVCLMEALSKLEVALIPNASCHLELAKEMDNKSKV